MRGGGGDIGVLLLIGTVEGFKREGAQLGAK